MNKTFQYLRPVKSREACELKAKHGKAAVFLAGGTDLLLDWRGGTVDFEYCIDLSFISDLDYIKCDENSIYIGSLTKIESIENSSDVKNLAPVLSDAASQMATPQIRNIATIGGNLCHGAPSADLATPLLALGAEARIMSVSGKRWINLGDFFLGVNKTALVENELLAEIRIQIPSSRTKAVFSKIGRTVVDIALVNAAVRVTLDEKDTLKDVRIALGAVAPVPFRSMVAENQLEGLHISKVNENLMEEVSQKSAADTKPISDIRAGEKFRREVSRVLVRRGIENVIKKLRGRTL